MHIYIYSPEFAEKTLLNKLRKNENTSLSGLFSLIRKRNDCELIGDIPLLCYCVQLFTQKKIPLSTSQILYALSKVYDYKKLSKSEKSAVGGYINTLVYLPQNNGLLTHIKRNPNLLYVNRIYKKL